MEPRRGSARSAGKIPINFLLSSAADTAGTGDQGARPTGGIDLQARRDNTSQESYPREVDSPRPFIPGTSPASVSLPGSWTTTLPPIRTEGRLYSSNSTASSGYDTFFSRDRRSSSNQTSPDRDLNRTLSNTITPSTSTDPANILIDRKPRTPRPSYSEEQKFFIMYSRIIRDNTWPEIEDRFEKLFGTRSKGGLTSVYYRVRREWGLMEVLKSGPGSYAADCREVEQRARNFSSEFLRQIGYLS